MKFSIITCTYNPNQDIFQRLLVSIENLIVNNNINFEWIVVDNNSKNPVQKQFSFNFKYSKVVIETKPGLTSARIAGAKEAKGDWLIFFDDDNEPKSDFIIQLQKGIEKYPHVNCWGPGRISVKFVGEEVSDWFKEHKHYFQERKEKTSYGSEKYMQPYYPIGTGLCITRDAMQDYIDKFDNGIYNVSDRTGSSLISGGDTQIVLNNQLLGNTAGKLEDLSLNHLIEARKANFKYLIKQKYWTASSYIIVLKQVYSDFNVGTIDKKFSITDVIYLIKIFYHGVKVKNLDYQSAYLEMCSAFGAINARYVALNYPKNKLFQNVEKILISR
ncbi:glycosyltransferase [Formosa sp. 3Alg 14/1]|uniref:glycosyltransferase n=1 Tax=Formosa sp. 3Alg 14/1 TaxID=3382190 RepID=UPI0039BE59BF